MQIQELNINENFKSNNKKIIILFQLYDAEHTCWDNMETYLAHIVYENIMFGQIEHQKCHF